MDAATIKEKLTVDDIIRLVTEGLGSNGNNWDASGAPIFQTVCHNAPGEGSYKLYYYPATKMFHCYTECGDSFDVFELVQRAKGYTTFVEAFQYVLNFFNIKNESKFVRDNSDSKDLIDDWDILSKYDYYQKLEQDYNAPKQELPAINENILEYFGPIVFPSEWANEHITPAATYKFGIRVDSALKKIIIPHRDINGKLVGIRGRSFDPIEVSEGKKYMPVYINSTCYKHPLGECLYGLYENLDAIKRFKKVMIVESEKSVMQCYSYYGEDCFTVATCGSSLSETQINTLLQLGIEEVILAYDRENDTDKTSAVSAAYREKLINLVRPLAKYMNVYIIFDDSGYSDKDPQILPMKASPTDLGQEVLEKLMHKKRSVSPFSFETITNTTRKKKI